jgi:hypothetical protein
LFGLFFSLLIFFSSSPELSSMAFLFYFSLFFRGIL